MLKPLMFGFAAFAMTAGGMAVAQDMGPPGGGGAMMRADANNDGVITRQEAIDQATVRFDRMDTNRDGKLDKSELQRIGQRLRDMRGDMPPPPAPAQPKQ